MTPLFRHYFHAFDIDAIIDAIIDAFIFDFDYADY
jgi:hypothetical protein